MALKADELPIQMADGDADGTIIGKLFTETVTVAVLVQPLALVAVTVYVVVSDGETLGEPVKLPGCHR
jgi:hypothetical protein